jgi:undecaprenyl-diphosphatase
MSIDWTLFELCNSLAGRSPTLDTVIRVLMNDYALTTALVLLLFGLWFTGKSRTVREQNQRAVLSAIASMLLGNLFVKALNLVFYRPRPFADHSVTLLFYRPSDSSFPSNPTSIGFCIATSVWWFNRKMGLVLYVLASLLGLARLFGGVHYPSDILGGALIGMFSAYLVGKRIHFVNHLWTVIIRQMRRLLLA